MLAEPIRFSSSVVTLWGFKVGVVAPAQPTSFCTMSHHSSASIPMGEKKEENREIDLKKTRGSC
jgi:hypothetical protein